MNYWERKEKLFKYTEGVRQFFPLANEQLDVIARIVDKFNPQIKNFLDLGCGDGFLGYFINTLYPDTKGVFMDISGEMIAKAKQKDKKNRFEFIIQDLSKDGWFKKMEPRRSFDLIISGYSIHHLPTEKKKRLYKNIYRLLTPHGLFLNLEHVSSPSKNFEELFGVLFDDGMMAYQKHIGEEKTREEIAEIYHDPNHQKLNVLEPVERQCEWLKDIGFLEVDCYMKIFELALFGGVKM